MTSRPLSLALALRCQSAIRGARRSLLVHSHQPVQTSRWQSTTCHPSIPTESPFSSSIYQLFCTFPAKRTRVPTWRRSDLATSSLEPTFNPCIWSTVICPPPTETGLQVATPLQLIFCLSTVAPSQRGVSSEAQAQPCGLCHTVPSLYTLTSQQQPQNNDVTDIIIDDSPAPMEVEEAPNVHDCKFRTP